MRWFALCLLFTVFLFSQCAQKPAKELRPNLVLIVADDLGWRDLGGFGNSYVKTPHLDQLAREGVKFVNGYASCTVCSPSRAALLTGRNPVTVNITDWIPGHQARRGPQPDQRFVVPEFNQELPHEEITLAERLKDAGYVTVSIGKWHLGGDGFLPTDQGFDFNIGGNEKGQPTSYYYPYKTGIPNLNPKPDSLYLTDRLGQEAVEFINQYRDTAFFLYLPFYTVHTPWQGKKELTEALASDARETDSLKRNPEFLAMVASLDQNVGRILDALEQHHIRERTLVVFTSDNGGLFVVKDRTIWGSDNRPLREGKGTHYEGGLRVPYIISWPGKIEAGRLSDEMIISTDIYPTLLEAAGLSVPDHLEGVSLWEHLSAGKTIDRETFFWHYPHYHRTTPGSVIRDGRYKLIRFYEDDHLELYDLEEDRSESNNLANKRPDLARELDDKLQQWLDQQGASLPMPNPLYPSAK